MERRLSNGSVRGLPSERSSREQNNAYYRARQILSDLNLAQRTNLSPVEKYLAMQPLVEEFAGLSQFLTDSGYTGNSKEELKDFTQSAELYKAYLERLRETFNADV